MRLPFSSQAKSWEPKGRSLRRLAAAGLHERLDPWELAPKVGLTVIDGHRALEALDPLQKHHLMGRGRNRWSGGIYPKPLPDGTVLCILNPFHSLRRNKITLMEEICHLHLGHRPTGVVVASDGLEVRDYNKGQELEAYGVGAAALLPWETFFPAVNGGSTVPELAESYDVTPMLVEYRIKITGAYRLYQARQRGRCG